MPGDFDNLFGDDLYLQTQSGVLEVLPGGWGFLRRMLSEPGAADIYVAQDHVLGFRLKTADRVIGQVRPPKETERYPVLAHLESVNGASVRQ